MADVVLNQDQDDEIQRLADEHAQVIYERNEGEDVIVGVYGDMQGALKETLVFLGFWHVDRQGVSEQMERADA